MAFGVISGVGRGVGVLDDGSDHRSFEGKIGASHCNQHCVVGQMCVHTHTTILRLCGFCPGQPG